jgi:hypothetical protein
MKPNFAKLIERVESLSVLDATHDHRHGISFEQLRRVDPFADEEDFRLMTGKEAVDVLGDLWDAGGYHLLGDSELSAEAFTFGCIFGDEIAAWLLEEAVKVVKVDRSYEMKEPPTDREITPRLAEQLYESRHDVLTNFRRLVAGYVGWQGRVEVTQ